MIVGTGMDIVEISRIQKVYDRFKDGFAKRILSNKEYGEYNATKMQIRFLAKRFAAKEAIAKALGTGFSQGVSPCLIQIGHDNFGQPLVEFIGVAKARAEALGVSSTWLSITDERRYAAASAIMEK